jgi:hypothetical protein
MPEIQVTLPLGWAPRDYQKPALSALESGTKRMCLVWHRRAGKDLFCVNWIATQIFQRVGSYWHVLPTYKQGRRIVWDGITKAGRLFLDHFPDSKNPGAGRLCVRRRDDMMQLWFANGSTYQVVGADEPDALIGANPVGIVFSEWSVMNPAVWTLLRPILAENGGWAIFIFTPRGRNHAYRTLKMAEGLPDWFSQVLTVDDTKAVDAEAIEADRRSGMSEHMIQQEYFCSFDAPLIGSYYGDIMAKMLEDKQITRVPYDPTAPVITAWDLGISDAMVVWFAQRVGREIRIIDYYRSSGKGMDHYAKVLHEKPYAYSEHLAPHDVKQREIGTGKSVLDQAAQLGLRMRVVPKVPVQDGILAVRALLPRCYIDEERCAHGIEALRSYTKEVIDEEQGPNRETVYRDTPLHNWASDPADAFRTLAVGLRPQASPSFTQPSARWVV